MGFLPSCLARGADPKYKLKIRNISSVTFYFFIDFSPDFSVSLCPFSPPKWFGLQLLCTYTVSSSRISFIVVSTLIDHRLFFFSPPLPPYPSSGETGARTIIPPHQVERFLLKTGSPHLTPTIAFLLNLLVSAFLFFSFRFGRVRSTVYLRNLTC